MNRVKIAACMAVCLSVWLRGEMKLAIAEFNSAGFVPAFEEYRERDAPITTTTARINAGAEQSAQQLVSGLDGQDRF